MRGLKLLLLSHYVLGYIFGGALLSFVPGSTRRFKLRTQWISFWSRQACRLLNIRVHSQDHNRLTYPALVVCNHLSYLDVLVLASIYPSGFVTSQEIKETAFLGLLCRIGGCVFVERRSRSGLKRDIGKVSYLLKMGIPVTVFPEATSSNGESVLRFKRGLFPSAIEAGVQIVPVCLNYRKVGGIDVNLGNRDTVFWYGDMEFFGHLLGVIGKGKIEVGVKFLEAICPSSHDGESLAKVAHARIEGDFKKIG